MVIKDYKKLQDSWSKFCLIVNEKAEGIRKEIQENLYIRNKKCESVLKIIRIGKDNISFLLKHKSTLLDYDSSFNAIIPVFAAAESSGALNNEAFLQFIETTLNEKKAQIESENEKILFEISNLENKISEYYDLIDEKNFGAIKELIEIIPLKDEEIINILRYVVFKSGREDVKETKKEHNSKFKSTKSQIETKNNEEKTTEILEKVKIEKKKYDGIKEKYTEMFGEKFDFFLQYLSSDKDIYMSGEEQLLSGNVLFKKAEKSKEDVEYMLSLIHSEEISYEIFYLLRTAIGEFQSYYDRLVVFYESFFKKQESPKQEDKKINPNVYFYITNPTNFLANDKAGVFSELLQKGINMSSIGRNRVKEDKNNRKVADRTINFKQIGGNNIISFIVIDGVGDNAKILVFASHSIKNNGVDKLHLLTKNVTKNEGDIEQTIEMIINNDPRFMELQDMVRDRLIDEAEKHPTKGVKL